ADCYLYTVLRWTRYVDVKLTPWPTLAAYVERMEARPEVRNALKAEAILK
ncbi:MAG: glutathione S-transferase family protein, partial [Pseudomonadota bacterium]|nr:glutathione S-transferase family protein [Pseudomonadota bacterium]